MLSIVASAASGDGGWRPSVKEPGHTKVKNKKQLKHAVIPVNTVSKMLGVVAVPMM